MTHPRRNPQIIWRIERHRQQEVLRALEAGEDAGERGTVLLIHEGTMHQLNLVAGMIWERCDGTRSLAQIVTELAAEFTVGAEELSADVDAFVVDLGQRGWLLDV